MPSDLMPLYRPDAYAIGCILNEIQASCKDLCEEILEVIPDYLLPALYDSRKASLVSSLRFLNSLCSQFHIVLRGFIKGVCLDVLAFESKYQAIDALHMKIEDLTRFSGCCPFLCEYGYDFFSLLAHIRLACSLLSHFLSAYVADNNIDLIALHQQQDACFHS